MDINQHSLAGCIAVYYIKDDEDHDTLADKIDLLCGQHPEDSIGRIIYGLWDTDKNGAFDIVQKLLKEIV